MCNTFNYYIQLTASMHMSGMIRNNISKTGPKSLMPRSSRSQCQQRKGEDGVVGVNFVPPKFHSRGKPLSTSEHFIRRVIAILKDLKSLLFCGVLVAHQDITKLCFV